jgi:hypothetical protein
VDSAAQLDTLRQRAILSSQAGFASLLALGLAWLAAGAASYAVPRAVVPWLYLGLGLSATSLGLAIGRRVGYLPAAEPDALSPLVRQLAFVPVVAFPAVVVVWDTAPRLVPLVFAALTGAQLLPLQWVYRTRLYGLLALLVSAGPFVLALRAAEDAIHHTGLFAGAVLLVGALFARSHARATWRAAGGTDDLRIAGQTRVLARATGLAGALVLTGYVSNVATRSACEDDLMAGIDRSTRGELRLGLVYTLPVPEAGAHSAEILQRAGFAARPCALPADPERLHGCFPWVSVQSSIVVPYLVVVRSEYVLFPTSGHGFETTFVTLFGMRWRVAERGLWVS